MLYSYNKELQVLKEKEKKLSWENEVLKEENETLHKEIVTLKKKLWEL